MQRPTVLRRRVGGAPDRRIAVGGLAVTAAAVVIAVALAQSPLPVIYTRDPQAAGDLVALMRAGERGGWFVRYDFTRALTNGRTLHQPILEARGHALHVLISGSSMTFERSGRRYECNVVGDQSQCYSSASGATLPASAVLRVAVASGAYDVVRRPGATIAGESARCFLVRVSGHGLLPDLGVEMESCLASDGIALRQTVLYATGVVDERVARVVTRAPSARTILSLVRSFDPEGALPSG